MCTTNKLQTLSTILFFKFSPEETDKYSDIEFYANPKEYRYENKQMCKSNISTSPPLYV